MVLNIMTFGVQVDKRLRLLRTILMSVMHVKIPNRNEVRKEWNTMT